MWEEAFFIRAAGVDGGQGWFWSKAVAGPQAARILEAGYQRMADRHSRSKKYWQDLHHEPSNADRFFRTVDFLSFGFFPGQ